MKLIERTRYLNKLLSARGTPDIKVITGVRRSGKSKLLEAFGDYIKKTDPQANIIYINFNLVKYECYQDYHRLNDRIESSYKEDCNNFVLIDEAQMCPKFELAIKETLIYFYAFLPKDDDLWYNKVIKEGWIGK